MRLRGQFSTPSPSHDQPIESDINDGFELLSDTVSQESDFSFDKIIEMLQQRFARDMQRKAKLEEELSTIKKILDLIN